MPVPKQILWRLSFVRNMFFGADSRDSTASFLGGGLDRQSTLYIGSDIAEVKRSIYVLGKHLCERPLAGYITHNQSSAKFGDILLHACRHALKRCGSTVPTAMPPTQRQSLMTVMAQATSPSYRLWPPETCDEHQSLTLGEPSCSNSPSEKGASTSSGSGERERAPWPVTLGTLLALQLGWGLWLMPAVYARSVTAN